MFIRKTAFGKLSTVKKTDRDLLYMKIKISDIIILIFLLLVPSSFLLGNIKNVLCIIFKLFLG